MTEIIIKVSDKTAREWIYFLGNKLEVKTKSLSKLVKLSILKGVAEQAQKEVDEHESVILTEEILDECKTNGWKIRFNTVVDFYYYQEYQKPSEYDGWEHDVMEDSREDFIGKKAIIIK